MRVLVLGSLQEGKLNEVPMGEATVLRSSKQVLPCLSCEWTDLEETRGRAAPSYSGEVATVYGTELSLDASVITQAYFHPGQFLRMRACACRVLSQAKPEVLTAMPSS